MKKKLFCFGFICLILIIIFITYKNKNEVSKSIKTESNVSLRLKGLTKPNFPDFL